MSGKIYTQIGNFQFTDLKGKKKKKTSSKIPKTKSTPKNI